VLLAPAGLAHMLAGAFENEAEERVIEGVCEVGLLR
jgi:hypothetical protein